MHYGKPLNTFRKNIRKLVDFMPPLLKRRFKYPGLRLIDKSKTKQLFLSMSVIKIHLVSFNSVITRILRRSSKYQFKNVLYVQVYNCIEQKLLILVNRYLNRQIIQEYILTAPEITANTNELVLFPDSYV